MKIDIDMNRAYSGEEKSRYNVDIYGHKEITYYCGICEGDGEITISMKDICRANNGLNCSDCDNYMECLENKFTSKKDSEEYVRIICPACEGGGIFTEYK